MQTKFNIPSPCSEDWNEMTPTDKGAFCDKCAFEVIDFTSMNAIEVRDTLQARAGSKTCAHISKNQLEVVNSDYHLWINQTPSIFRSKFLYACMLTFGMGLFTACSPSPEYIEGEIETPMGMVEEVGMVTNDTLVDDTTSCDVLIDGMMDVTGELEELPGLDESE